MTTNDIPRIAPHLAAVGASVNLVFHDVAPTDDELWSPYDATLGGLLDIVEWLKVQGLSRSTRLYFDDNHRSLYDIVLDSFDVSVFLEVVAAVPVTSIGRPGRGTWSDLDTARRRGVRIAVHGYSHIRLASYDITGTRIATPPLGPYTDRDPHDPRPLYENEVLYQLVEARTALDSDEFVLPYGCYNATTLAINDRLGLYTHLATTDFELDHGQLLRPRLLVKADDTAHTIEQHLLREVHPTWRNHD